MKSIVARLALAGLAGVALSSIAIAQDKTGVVRIGMNESLSGQFQPVGVPPGAAVRLAVKEINDAGGFVVGDTKYTLELVETDNQSEPASAIAGVTKLVEDEGIKFIFGPTQSGMAIQTAEVTVPADVIQFSAASLWQSRGLLNDPDKPLLFGTQNPVPAITTFDIAGMKELGAKKVAVISQDDETTKSTMPSMTEDAKAAGIEVIQILFPTNATDLTSYVSRAKAEGADMIYYFFPQARVSEVLRATLDLQAAPTFGGRAINPKAAVSEAIGKPIPIPFYSSFSSPSFEFPPNEKVQAFRDRLLAFEPAVAGGHATFSFFSYDFVPMLVEAMKKAGTVEDTAAIGKALHEITYDGVIGKICYGAEIRTAQSDGGLIFVRDGQIDSRVFPSPCN
jgi:ABC-type branched-subunit amino acid transport system substrate-binding protein